MQKKIKIGSNRPGRIWKRGRRWKTPKCGRNKEIENYKS